MKLIISSLLIAASSITPITIGSYISRVPNYCQRFDAGEVYNVLRQRERIAFTRLSPSQVEKRVRSHLRGAYFARNAAQKAGVRGCMQRIPSQLIFSRTRNL